MDEEALRLDRREQMQGDQANLFAAANARLRVAMESDTPFPERLVHFWSNHFAVSLGGLPIRSLAADYEFGAIRQGLGGNFAELLHATARHPAMLLYLNQAQSFGPQSPVARRRAARNSGRALGLNENLAREILELHTLGVRSGYTQADVTELARALTGWTVAGTAGGSIDRFVEATPGTAVFVEELHEPGTRTVLGQSFADTGAQQAPAILERLARHPSTARHIATKLARHFIADDPPAAAVERLANVFTDTDGDLPSLHRALIAVPEVWNAPRLKFRSHWDWVVAALRASGDATMIDAPRAGYVMLESLGQTTWSPGSPAGWGDRTSDWASPGALMARVELANRFGHRLRRDIVPSDLAAGILGDALEQETLGVLRGAEDAGMGLAVMLASPEFMRR